MRAELRVGLIFDCDLHVCQADHMHIRVVFGNLAQSTAHVCPWCTTSISCPRVSILLELGPCALCRFLPGKDPRKLLREEAYTGLLTTAIGIRMSKVAQARSLRTRASGSGV